MRASAKGRVTIAKSLREWFGIVAGDEIVFGTEGEAILLRKSDWAEGDRPTLDIVSPERTS